MKQIYSVTDLRIYGFYLAIALLLLPVINASAQEFSRHEVVVYGGGGIANIQYQQAGATTGGSFGATAGLGYTFFFARQWGISTGAEWQSFGASVKRATITSRSQEQYSFGGATEDMYFDAVYTGYEESQRAAYVQVPLLLQFQTRSDNRFYIAAGAKAGFAVSGTYKVTATQLATSGYFPEIEQTFTDMPNHGFVTLQNPSVSGNLDFGLHIALAAETGMRWRLGNNMGLYTGLWLDYGLTDISPEKVAAAIVNYQSENPSEWSYNSILTATDKTNNSMFVDKISLLSAGIKVKLAFGL